MLPTPVLPAPGMIGLWMVLAPEVVVLIPDPGEAAAGEEVAPDGTPPADPGDAVVDEEPAPPDELLPPPTWAEADPARSRPASAAMKLVRRITVSQSPDGNAPGLKLLPKTLSAGQRSQARR